MEVQMAEFAKEYKNPALIDKPWFIPNHEHVTGGGDGTLTNANAVCWSSKGDNGPPIIVFEIVPSFNTKLKNAYEGENQTNWDQYSCSGYEPNEICGYPQGPTPVDEDRIAGVGSCALINSVAIQAGYTCVTRTSDISDYKDFPEVLGSHDITVGNVVLYDWEDNGTYDHIGIITVVNYDDWWKCDVISAIDFVEVFNYGVSEQRLNVFGDVSFENWPSEWDNWEYKVVDLPEPD
jgi:hypothetical protein